MPNHQFAARIPASNSWRHAFAQHAAVLGCYLLLSLLLTWPLARELRGAIYSQQQPNAQVQMVLAQDGLQNIWNMAWTWQALGHGQNPYWTPLLYYPDGAQLYLQTLNLAITAPFAPVTAAFGPVVAFNLAVLAVFTLTGYTAFLLARELGARRSVALLCGALLTAAPFHMQKFVGFQINLLSIHWLPLCVLALLRLEKRRTLANGALLAGALVLVVLTDWYWAMICGVFIAAWLAVQLARGPDRLPLLRCYALVGTGTLAALSPLLAGMYVARSQLPQSGPNEMWQLYTRGYSADLFGIGFPSVFQPLWGAAANNLVTQTAPGFSRDGWYVAGGWVLLVCTAIGVWRAGRRYWPLLAAGGACWLLSLGPLLRVGGYETALPLPYALLELLPLVGQGRRPSHFAVMTLVSAVAFAALGLERIAASRNGRRWLALIAVAASVELFPAAWVAVPIPPVAPVYAQIRTLPGAVADLPIENDTDSRTLVNQLVHGQPILGGYLARRPDYPILAYQPWLHQLAAMQPALPDVVQLTAAQVAAMQCATPIRHVVVQKRLVTLEQQAALAAVLAQLNGGPLAPQFADANVTWYELPLAGDYCAPFVYLGAGWFPPQQGATTYRWGSSQNDIWLENPFRVPSTAWLTFRIASFAPDGAAHTVRLYQGEQAIAAWNVTPAAQFVRLPLLLPPGTTRLRLLAPTTYDAASKRDLSVSLAEVALENITCATPCQAAR